MLVEVVLRDDVVWEYGYWHLHVFVSLHWSAKIEVFDVKACISGVGGADCAVPQYFCGGKFGCARSEFAGVVNEVTSCGEADAVGVCFLRAVVHNDACVCDCAIAGDVADLVVGEDIYGVGTWRLCEVVALCEITEFLSKRACPSVS